jgi:hypothetical protein
MEGSSTKHARQQAYKKGSIVSSTLAHAAIMGTHKYTHRHTQQGHTSSYRRITYTWPLPCPAGRCPAPGLHARRTRLHCQNSQPRCY